jgi:translation initiation factor 2 subunit 2
MSDDDEDNLPREEENEEGEVEEADMAAMLDLSKKKKKKKKKTTTKSITEDSSATGGGGDQSLQTTLLQEQDKQQEHDLEDPYDRKGEYTYEELLDRVVKLLHANNPDLVEKKRRNIKPPQLTLMGSKKTLWVNFQEICTMMQRSPEHVFQFFMAELGTEGSIDGNQRLVIRGKYVPKYIESLLRKYVVEYVTCEMCRSPNTTLERDSGSRLYFCSCKDCGSRRSVAPIRSGYHATSRADRRAARNAKG